MFGLFKKKTQKPTEKLHLEQSKVTNPEPEITMDEIVALVREAWRGNVGSSLYYAQCGGFDKAIIGYEETDIERYNEIVLSDEAPNFSIENKLNALKFFEDEGSHFLKEKRSLFRTSLTYINREELANALFNLSIDIKKSELAAITNKLDEKWEYVGPIFKRHVNASIDKYGDMDLMPVLDELTEFIDHFFDDDDFAFFGRVKPWALLLRYVGEKLDLLSNEVVSPIPDDGIEFEHWCADQIAAQGWQVKVSQASGDQGVDIVARRDGTSVVVQCKRYTQPVGNKAVQEIFAAKEFQSADHAAVIGTGGFTKSAIELATATSVRLIDAETEIMNFSSIYGYDSPQPNEFLASSTIEIRFRTKAEGALGSLIRNGLKAFDADQFGETLDEERLNYILESINETTGEGSLECTPAELTTLIVVAKIALEGSVTLTEEGFEAINDSDLYNGHIAGRLGETVSMTELFSEERLETIFELLEIYTEQLPELYRPLALRQFSDFE